MTLQIDKSFEPDSNTTFYLTFYNTVGKIYTPIFWFFGKVFSISRFQCVFKKLKPFLTVSAFDFCKFQ